MDGCAQVITVSRGGNANTDIALKIPYNTKIVALTIVVIKDCLEL